MIILVVSCPESWAICIFILNKKKHGIIPDVAEYSYSVSPQTCKQSIHNLWSASVQHGITDNTWTATMK